MQGMEPRPGQKPDKFTPAVPALEVNEGEQEAPALNNPLVKETGQPDRVETPGGGFAQAAAAPAEAPETPPTAAPPPPPVGPTGPEGPSDPAEPNENGGAADKNLTVDKPAKKGILGSLLGWLNPGPKDLARQEKLRAAGVNTGEHPAVNVGPANPNRQHELEQLAAKPGPGVASAADRDALNRGQVSSPEDNQNKAA